MAKKQRKQEPASSRSSLTFLAIGVILVAAILGWALTRTVEPTPTATFAPPPPVGEPVTEATEAPAVATPDTAPTSTQPVTPPVVTQPPTVAGSRSEPSDPASVRRIAAEDLRAKLNRGEVVVVDVRDVRSYETGHIPGAIHAAFANIESSIGILPRNKPIVTYCT